MRKIKILITFGLLFLLVYLRIQVRALNSFSADELKEISSFQSLRFLFFDFLPSIPGGAPGDYLVVFPFHRLFPSNHYLLVIPGLLSNILAFVFIPKVISKLKIVADEYNYLIATVTRLFFVFDPTLTFQAMEIRPYANLPFYWILNVFLVSHLIKIDRKGNNSIKAALTPIIFAIILTVLFVWHYYMVIMFLSVYFFFIFEAKKEFVVNLFSRKSFYVLITGLFFALPFWRYFSSQTGVFPYHTFDWLGMSIAQIYAIDKGGQHGLIWQNWIYFFFLLCMIFLFFATSTRFFQSKNKGKIAKDMESYFQINIFLVALPLAAITILDVFTSYMFLYRQFAWIMLPFYIANAVAINGLLISTKRLRD